MLTQAVRLVLLAAVVVATPPLSVPCPVAPAGVGRITGHVRDSAGQPLAGAQVVVVGTRFAAVTDRTGAYAIASVPEGAYSVRAMYIGYTALEVHGIRVKTDSTTSADFTLQAASASVAAVVVTAVPATAAKRAE